MIDDDFRKRLKELELIRESLSWLKRGFATKEDFYSFKKENEDAFNTLINTIEEIRKIKWQLMTDEEKEKELEIRKKLKKKYSRPKMELIDTHAHLYSSQFRDDLGEVIKRAKEAGITKALMPNVDSASISDLHALAERYPDFCIPMMGLHPCSVKKDYKKELAIIEKNLRDGKYIAVGEIGLDYYWDKTFTHEQHDAFITQVNWAKELNLPIAIHTRESFDDAVKLLQGLQDGNLRGVFHCFSGTLTDAQRVIELGFYMGIGGVVTFKNSEIGNAIPHIDLKHVALETDAPYLAPVPHRGKRNESGYTKLVAEKIASAKNISPEEVAAVTSANARALFQALN